MRPYPRAVVLAVVAAIVCACTSSANAPAVTQTPEPTARGADAPPAIALVFDTGTDAGNATEVLDALRREHIRASFIVTGIWAEQHRDLLLAITAAGHQLINGGYHGTSFTGVSTMTPPLTHDERSLELSRTEVTVYHLTGRSTRPYWRPPYGDIDDAARGDAAEAGYTMTVTPKEDTASWSGSSAATIVERLTAAAAPDATYILHIGSAQDVEALPSLITELRARGLALGAVEDLHPR
jgi:peptidoglycan/xylan/chitin deacetylase (PgdA/CDA1 family)